MNQIFAMSRRQSARSEILEAKRAEQRQVEQAIMEQMFADRRNMWLSQLNPVKEQLLGRLPEQVMDFDIPENLKYVAKERPRTKKGLPFGVPHYRSLVRNLYRPPLYRNSPPEGDDIPICSCSPETGCGPHCANRQLYMECHPGKCPSCIGLTASTSNDKLNGKTKTSSDAMDVDGTGTDIDDENEENGTGTDVDDEVEGGGHGEARAVGGIYCANTAIQRRNFPKTEVYDPHNGCGFALRVAEDVGPSTILIEYLGEVISEEECNERMSTCTESDAFYFAALGQGLFLDALPMGSTARFANHSCDPTCELQRWVVKGEPRICLVSLRAMRAGEEITYNYQYYQDGFDNAGEAGDAFRRQKCMCGAENCCGTIGGRVEESASVVWQEKVTRILDAKGSHKVALDVFYDMVSAKTLVAAKVPPDSPQLAMLKELIAKAEAWEEAVAKTVPRDVFYYQHLPWYDVEEGSDDPGDGFDGPGPDFVSLPDLQNLVKNAPLCVKVEALPALKESLYKAEHALAFTRDLLAIVKGVPNGPNYDRSGNGLNSANNGISEASLALNIKVPGLVNSNSSGDSVLPPAVPALGPVSGAPVKAESGIAPTSAANASAQSADAQSTAAAHPSHGADGKTENTNSAPAAVGKRARMYWEDLASAFRQFGAAMPVLCGPSEIWELLSLYQQCSNECRRHLNGIRPLGLGIELLERGDKLLWNVVKKLSEAYRFPVTPDYFLAHSFLENRVVAAVSRPKFSDVLNRGARRPPQKGKKKKENEEDKLYCYCQLPEHEGEIATLAQCDYCREWYHPHCINSTIESVSRPEFMCPGCALSQGSTMNCTLAWPVATEWKILPGEERKESLPEVKKPSKPAAKAGSRTMKMKNTAGEEVVVVRAPKRRRTAADTRYTTFLNSNAHLRKPVPMIIAGTAEYLTPKSLEECISQEEKWPVCNTSVIQKLQILEKFLKAWEDSAAAFLAKPQVSNIEATVASTSESVDHRELLKEAMELYLAMRVVRIQPSVTNLKLRAVAWKLSTIPLQRAILATPFESNGSQNPASNLIAAFCSHIRSKAVDAQGLLCPSKLTDLLRATRNTDTTPTTPLLSLQNLREVLKGGIGLGIQAVASSTMQRLILFQQGTDHTLRETKVYLQRVAKEASGTLGAGSGQAGVGEVNTAVSQAINLAYNTATSVLAANPPTSAAGASVPGLDVYNGGASNVVPPPTASAPNALILIKRKLVVESGLQQALLEAILRTIGICSVLDLSNDYGYCSTMTLLAAMNGKQVSNEFCWCLGGEGPQYGAMIECDGCQRWFHVDCVSRRLTPQVVKKTKSYLCITCAASSGRSYPWMWR